jgi:fatty-acid peroxygenase
MTREIGLRLLRHGYDAVESLRTETGAGDWFLARMLGRRALVLHGEEGVRAFYDPGLVTRKGAIPAPLRLLLFGRGAVHGLDGPAHRARKQMHLDLVERTSVARLVEEVTRRLEATMNGWQHRGSVSLFEELTRVYGTSVISWAGIDVDEAEARTVVRDLATVVDAFGVRGTSHVRGYAARIRVNRWARRMVREVRRGARSAEGTVLGRVAANRSLSDGVAGVELLNILRPTVAVAYFGVFLVLGLDERPDWRPRLAAGDADDLRAFGHEVRRYYPFVPLLTGRLAREFRWGDQVVQPRGFMVLDVIGTNRDPARWPRPATFDPDRFVGREPNAFEYVPHGGGDPARGHRCPGEPLAVGILEVTARELARIDYAVDEESLDVPRRRVPSLPAGGVRLRAFSSPHRVGQHGSA